MAWAPLHPVCLWQSRWALATGGQGVKALFILTYWEGRHKSIAETKRVCRGGRGCAVSPDQLLFPVVTRGCSVACVRLH